MFFFLLIHIAFGGLYGVDISQLHCAEYNNTSHRCEMCSSESEYYQDREGCILKNGTQYETCQILR